MKHVLITFAVLAVTGLLLWQFPLFHVVSLRDVQASRQQTAFNAAQFADSFWNERLLPALDRAADAATVLAVARQDPGQARQQFGRTAGLGRAAYFFLSGDGTVVSTDDKGVGVSLGDDQGEPDILLDTGLLFGSTICDATGLLGPSDFSDSRQFNDVATELNRIVEDQVIPGLRAQAQVGRRLRFVGCAKVLNGSDWHPLEVIPLEVKFD